MEESIFQSLRGLLLFDDIFLQMQARNIDLVDSYLRDLEKSLLNEYEELERTPVASATFVSALSQLWIFGLYELLRTWVQRASDILKLRARLHSIRNQPDYNKQKEKILEQRFRQSESARAQGATENIIYRQQMIRIVEDESYGKRLEQSKKIIIPVYAGLESLRVNLAKHEVPGAVGSFVFGAGYGRIDTATGSIYWMVEQRDGYTSIVSRRELADEIINLRNRIQAI